MGNKASIESKVEDKPISQILYLLAQELWSRNEENNSKVEQKKRDIFLSIFLGSINSICENERHNP